VIEGSGKVVLVMLARYTLTAWAQALARLRAGGVDNLSGVGNAGSLLLYNATTINR